MKHLVLVGGGHAHLFVLKRFADRAVPGVRLTLVSDVPAAPYSGMLTGHIAGLYRRDEMYVDLRPLAQAAGAELVLSAANGLDLRARQIRTEQGHEIDFDALSIDCGGVPDPQSLPGLREYGCPIKPVGLYLENLDRFLSGRGREAQPRILQIGAGAGGVEVALALWARLRSLGTQPEMTVLEAGSVLLPDHPAGVRREFERVFAEREIALRLAAPVARLTASGAHLESGEYLAADFISVCTPARPPAWLAQSGLASHPKGFVQIDAHLQTSEKGIFAAGDAAIGFHQSWPRAGVFAVRQGPVLAENLIAFLQGRPLREWHPQKKYLSLMIDGRGAAVASRAPFYWPRRPWIWHWKDRIDRGFLERFKVRR